VTSIDVIGGSGFIGSRLVARLLAEGRYDVKIIDKAPSQAFGDLLTVADVRSADELSVAVSDGAVIVNLAAEHRDDVTPRSLYDEVNVQGAVNICEAAEKKGVNVIVFTSSVAVYGFAPLGADEHCEIKPFNDYGRTKFLAENVFRSWQSQAPDQRTLVVIRPTVVFGERNRGNVYNLLKQVASGRFVMIGNGENRKSLAYVENVAAFIEHSMTMGPGVHTFNYVDKPDFSMNDLLLQIGQSLGQSLPSRLRLPFWLGFLIGKAFDLASALRGRSFAISSIRVKKFCANSVYNTAVERTGFRPPVALSDALEKTIRYEFLETHVNEHVFFSE
jgi:nucleoside-diphosphate-sugar epimerase